MLIPINLLDTSRANYAVYGFGIVTSKNAYDLSNPFFYSAVCLVTCYVKSIKSIQKYMTLENFYEFGSSDHMLK